MRDLREQARALRALLAPRRREPMAAPDDHGLRLGAVERSDGSLRVVWDSSRGKPFVSFRLWRRDAGGGWLPQRSAGFSVRLNELPDLADAVAAALDEAERWMEGRGR
jgi:hypothetical protein